MGYPRNECDNYKEQLNSQLKYKKIQEYRRKKEEQLENRALADISKETFEKVNS